MVFRPFANLTPPFRGLSPLQQNIHIHICRCHSDTKSLAWVLGGLPYIYIYICIVFHIVCRIYVYIHKLGHNLANSWFTFLGFTSGPLEPQRSQQQGVATSCNGLLSPHTSPINLINYIYIFIYLFIDGNLGHHFQLVYKGLGLWNSFNP